MRHLTSLSGSPTLWRSIPCQLSELRLDFVLPGGQAFRWRESSPGYWTGVLLGRVWTLTQKDDHIWYTVYPNTGQEDGELQKVTQKRAVKRKLPHTTREMVKMEQIKQEKEEVDEDFHLHVDYKKDSETLQDYFQLHVRLSELYQQWAQSDKNFQNVARDFPGIRVLRQDPIECLFSFICTSNNHISRITGMIERLCIALGTRLCQLDSVEYYSFPTLQALAADDTEDKLRELGFGYRAKFVSESARTILHKHGPDWLESLRLVPYGEAKSALCALPGVGAKLPLVQSCQYKSVLPGSRCYERLLEQKQYSNVCLRLWAPEAMFLESLYLHRVFIHTRQVADCVCLMALDKSEAVPVDTHVWQIAKRDYLPQLGQGNKSLTNRVYREIGDYFHSLWGPYAGWAQGVLFCSDLKKFQSSGDPLKPRTKTKKKLKEEN